MKKATKGAILKHRIKEMGYTQEKFSEQTGVPYSTLKKYIADKCPYDIDLLERFAEKLECSYDYLMGYSVSPDRELQSVKDATMFSDEAIKKIQFAAQNYSDEYYKNHIDSISRIIERELFIDSISNFLYPTELTQMAYDATVGLFEGKCDVKMNPREVMMMNIMNELYALKYDVK